MWLLYAIGSAVFAGATSILCKIGIKNTNSNVATAVRTIVVLIFSWVMVFVVGSQTTIGEISQKSLLFLVLSGIATGCAWLCYYKALQIGDVNKVVPIDKSSTVLTMLLAIIILDEQITIAKAIGMVIILVGTMLMITKYETQSVKGRKWLVYAVLSALFSTLTAILAKIGITDVESNLGTAIRTGVVLIMAWLVVFATNNQKAVREIPRYDLAFILLSGIATGASWLCYYKALQIGEASLVVPIDKLSIVVAVAFSRVALKEKLTRKALLGLVIIVVGTLLLLVK